VREAYKGPRAYGGDGVGEAAANDEGAKHPHDPHVGGDVLHEVFVCQQKE